MDNQSISTPKTKLTPMDFFLYAGFIIALITVVVSFINLSFNALERLFPDPLNRYYTMSTAMQAALAYLIIAFPVLVVLAKIIRKTINKVPEKANLMLRKWVLYAILFISGLIALGDIITLIRYFLMGDLGTLFISKILVVLLVAVILFVYFVHQLTYENEYSKKSVKVFEWVSALVFGLVVVFGFIMMGSPAKQRQIRFDDQRVNDLQTIQWQVINYYQQYGNLPADLVKLADPLSSSSLPIDPSMDPLKQYEYLTNPKDKNEFSLCAVFDLSTDEANKYKESYGGGSYYEAKLGDAVAVSSRPWTGDVLNDNWAHDTGRACFKRVIDPVRYPMYKAQ